MRRRIAIIPALAFLIGVAFSAPSGVSAQNPPEPPKAASPADYPEGLVHSVVTGDTLWDLSAKYLGTPWKWPELWEQNRFLTNPHYIYPGIKIVVFPPPTKEYAFGTRKEEVPAAATEAPATVPEAPAPPPEKVPEPSPTPPVPAKPALPPVLDIKPLDYVRAGEFLREKPAGIGFIRQAREPKVAFSEGDVVYLDLKKQIPAGQLLAVYRVRGPIAAPVEGRVSGYVKYLVGIVQAMDKTDGGATAKVRTSFEDLTKEDLVSEEIPGFAPVLITQGDEGLEAGILSGRTENVELAKGDFIYFNKGTAAGIAVGNVFRIMDGGSGMKDGASGKDRRLMTEVGQAVVVRASAEFATAYVSKSQQSFQAGTRVRRGGTGTP